MTITAVQKTTVLKFITGRLHNNLAASQLVDWNPHADELNDRNALNVIEQRGSALNVTETTGAVADLSSGVQSLIFGGELITLNTFFGFSMGASDLEMVKTLGDARRNHALNEGLASMASKIDYHIMKQATEAFPLSTGDWGTALTSPTAIASARTRLAENQVESDMGLSTVITHADRQALATYIYNDNASLASEGPRAMRSGFSGMIDGIPVKASNQLGSITTGTRDGVGAVAGANQNQNYSAVSEATSAGGYMVGSLVVDTMGSSITVKKGEVFTIAGVYGWDTDTGRASTNLRQFVVTADATSDSAGSITLSIYPAIINGDGTTTIGTGGLNNAHRTVSAVPADNAVVTFLGAASTTYTPRVMFKKEAITVHTAQLMIPYSGTAFRRSVNVAQAEREGTVPVMPRVWFDSTHATGAHVARVDLFLQAQVRRRDFGIKFFG